MKKKNIPACPLGFEEMSAPLQAICQKGALYRKTRDVPGPLQAAVDPGEGRTCFLEYMADLYEAYGVLSFESSSSRYLEITLDGSPRQMANQFAWIRERGEYRRNYEGIVAIDAMALAQYLKKDEEDGSPEFWRMYMDVPPLEFFPQHLQQVAAHAAVVIFTPSHPTEEQADLLELIAAKLPGLLVLKAPRYSFEDLAGLTRQFLSEWGISCMKDVQLANLIEKKKLKSVKDAKKLARQLAVAVGSRASVTNKDLAALLLYAGMKEGYHV